MNVTSKISVDLTRPNMGTWVNAVQGDGNTRIVKVSLLSGGEAWEPPADAEAAIAYYQLGGVKGLYNLLADGSAAISISGNVVTIVLAPQMLTASGIVQASLVFNDASLNRLTTFPFSVFVESNPAAGAQKVEDYLRLQWLEEKLDEYLRKAADSGEFDGKDGDPGADGHTPEYGVDYGTPEQIAGIAQSAAVILQPEVDQIMDDLADKLPKSPADWEAWTAEEQAAARERIGIDKPVERIEELTVTEEGTTVIERTVTPTGDDYKFRRLIVCVESKQNSTTAQVTFQATSDGGKTYTITVNNLINTTNRLSQVEFFISNGVLKAMYTAPNSNGYWSGTVNTNANLMIFGSHIKKLRLYAVGGASFAAESKFTIYGVRA